MSNEKTAQDILKELDRLEREQKIKYLELQMGYLWLRTIEAFLVASCWAFLFAIVFTIVGAVGLATGLISLPTQCILPINNSQ